MTLFELICLAVFGLAVLNGLIWLADKLDELHYLSDDEIEQRIKEANRAIENRPRVRAITESTRKNNV